MNKLLLALCFGSSAAFAEIAFDGYYKIENNGKHVGFAVKRVEFDAAKKTRTTRYFIHTSDRDRKNHEVKFLVISSNNYHPLESDYTEVTDGKTEHVHLKFSGNSYENTFQSKAGKDTAKWPLKPDTVLTTDALPALLSRQPAKSKTYKYRGIQSSTGKPNEGQIQVLDVKTSGALKVYRLFDDYDFNPIETWIAGNGDVIKEIVPDRKVTVTLVKDADAAIGSLEFNRSELVKVFNEIPLGQKNVVATAKSALPEFSGKYSTKFKQDPNAIPMRLVPDAVSK